MVVNEQQHVSMLLTARCPDQLAPAAFKSCLPVKHAAMTLLLVAVLVVLVAMNEETELRPRWSLGLPLFHLSLSHWL